MIVVKKFVFNPFSENTYVLWDEDTLEGMIVDPGCIDPYEEQQLENFISERKIFVKYLIITHSHIDHILGCRFVKNKFSPFYLVPEADLDLLKNAEKQGAAFGLEIDPPPLPDQYLKESSEISLGSSRAKVLFTPGHSPGEHCIYFENEEICLTGDVLFQNSIGRTDLWGGDYQTLMTSIRLKLFTLPDEVVIYPGHGDSSKIGIEKRENPFVTEFK
jgi:glyoxylase-like metal-dependent hydrolase (beta-lactamase superfamily II)